MPCMVLFSPEMNWVNPLIEELEYETVIMPGYDGSEQRQALRDKPHRRLSFQVTALEAREAGLLEAFVRGAQTVPCLVPYWRGARYLRAAVNSLDTAVLVDSTAHAGFEVGQGAVFYRSPYEVEATRVTGIAAQELTVSRVIAKWRAKQDRIVPAFAGLLSPSVSLDYAAKFAKQAPLTFDLDIEGNDEIPQLPDFPAPPVDLIFEDNFNYADTAAMLANWTFEQNDFPFSYVRLDTFPDCRGKSLGIHVPFGAQSFHVGPTAYHTVTGLVPGNSYVVEGQMAFDPGFMPNTSSEQLYDISFDCAPGTQKFYDWRRGQPGRMITARVLGTADGSGSFQVRLNWAFLAFNTVFQDAAIYLSKVRVFARAV